MHDATIELAEYDPAWPGIYEHEAARIRAALGSRVELLEHAGSTSVPGLAAKPRIDIVLAVADSADKASYVPPLEPAGYALRMREPDWYEHRALKWRDPEVNLHVFPKAARRSTASSPSATSYARTRPTVSLRTDEARPGSADLGVRAGLRRRQEGGRRRDPGAGR